MSEVTLSEVCERIDYGLTTSATAEGGPKFLRITDIDRSHVDWSNVPHCRATELESAKYALERGDVVVARTGASTGRSQWLQNVEPAVFASYLVRFRAGPDIRSRFLGYVLDSRPWHHYVSSVAHGKSAQPNMSASAMGAFRFRLPDTATQVAVEEVLGALEDKAAAEEQVARRAEDLVVVIGSTANETCSVDTLAVYQTRASNPSSFLPQVALFSLPAFDSGFEPEEAMRDDIKSNKIVLDRPAVLVSKLNPRIPRIWNVNEVPKPMAVASPEFVVLLPSAVSATVLWSSLKQPAVSTELAGKVAGTSGSHQRVKPADILSLEVPDPRRLPDRAIDEIDRLGLLIATARSGRKALTKTRDELLPLLMSGRLQVKDAKKIIEEAL